MSLNSRYCCCLNQSGPLVKAKPPASFSMTALAGTRASSAGSFLSIADGVVDTIALWLFGVWLLVIGYWLLAKNHQPTTNSRFRERILPCADPSSPCCSL